MQRFVSSKRAKFLKALAVLAVAVFVGDGPGAATPRVDESQLLGLGFKVLVATTKVQQDWVRTLPPGQMKALQRNGKKFFVYPDASKSQEGLPKPKVGLGPFRGKKDTTTSILKGELRLGDHEIG